MDLKGRVVTAEDDRKQVFAFIDQVFQDTFGSGGNRDTQDEYAEYLTVQDDNDQIVGTYRLVRSDRAKQNKGFASEALFELDSLYKISELSLELGRAAVHPEYRDGRVIGLLWSMIQKYMLESGARYLFGCSSIPAPEGLYGQAALLKAEKTFAYLKEKDGITYFPAFPRLESRIHEFRHNLDYDKKEDKHHVPTLFKGYCKQGAKFAPYPVHDAKAHTIDFFTIFDVSVFQKKRFSKLLDD